MPFIIHGLRPVFEGQGEFGFTVWTYAANDPLEEMLEEGYFNSAMRLFRPGDLIFLGPTRRPAGSGWPDRTKETRRALAMVAHVWPGRSVGVRLVLDFGRPEDPGLPPAASRTGAARAGTSRPRPRR